MYVSVEDRAGLVSYFYAPAEALQARVEEAIRRRVPDARNLRFNAPGPSHVFVHVLPFSEVL